MLRSYELTIIFRTKVPLEDQKKFFDDIKKLLAKEGKLKETKDWGRRVLSYSIKKETEGNFFLLTYEAEPDQSSKISDMLKMSDKVLRYLVVRN